MSLTAYERETTIVYNDEDDFAIVYTCQRPMMTRLDKLCKSNPDSYQLVKQDEESKTYHCPKKLISFRTPVKREMTEEQKEVMRERMKNLHKNKRL